MESVNPIDLVRLLYEFDRHLTNTQIIGVLEIVFNHRNTDIEMLSELLRISQTSMRKRYNALTVQKARLRQQGMKIPDGRKSQ
jgi:galactokinase